MRTCTLDTTRETTLVRVTDSTHTRARADLLHSERLYVPWWDWVLPLIGAGLLAAQAAFAFSAVPEWLPYAVLLSLAVAVILGMSRTRIAVSVESDGPRLWVGDAKLPLRYIAAVDAVSKTDKRRALGPELDPAAFCVHKPWIRTMVRVHLDDPDDPTPYWIFSTRRPDKLVGLLTADDGEHAP